MKKTGYVCLMLAAALSFTACGGTEKTQTTAENRTTEATAQSEASTEEHTELMPAEGKKRIDPLQEDQAVISEQLSDGAYIAALDAKSFQKGAEGSTIGVELFSFDRFAPEAIEAMEEGDVICVAGNDIAIKEFSLKNEAENAFKGADINGGVENGGVSLMKDGDYYRTQSTDDHPLYYSLGSVVLPIDAGAVLMDFSDLSQPSGITYTADQLEEVFGKEDMSWGAEAVSIVVKSGKIVQIFRTYTP